MARCLELAARGIGKVAPNPMVGCVIVHQNEIISEGWHQEYGQNHAERNAILAIENDPRLRESSLYVNLEPCAHHGKTPPCAELIKTHGIREVIYGCRDPFEQVNGKGLQILSDAGIKIIGPVLENECVEFNRRFFTFHTEKRPYIILKWAETADGYMAPLDRKRTQISGEEGKILLHQWRAEEASVLVGANTALYDSPQLDVRYWHGKNPLRLFIDGNLRAEYASSEIKTYIFNYNKTEIKGNNYFIRVDIANPLSDILGFLYTENIQSIIVEGGANTLQRFIDAGLWDEMRVIKSKNVLFHQGIAAPKALGKQIDSAEFPSDNVNYFRRNRA